MRIYCLGVRLCERLCVTVCECVNVLQAINQQPALPLCSRRFSPLCVSCNEPIIPAQGSEETVRVVALEKNFHLKCYRCEVKLNVIQNTVCSINPKNLTRC